MANLIMDINQSHGARNSAPDGCTLVARLLLGQFSADEIFAKAGQMARSRFIREAIRFNGAVGVVDIEDVLHGTEGKEAGKERPEYAAYHREWRPEMQSDRDKFLQALRNTPEIKALFGRPEKCIEKVNEVLRGAGFEPLGPHEIKETGSPTPRAERELPKGDRD